MLWIRMKGEWKTMMQCGITPVTVSDVNIASKGRGEIVRIEIYFLASVTPSLAVSAWPTHEEIRRSNGVRVRVFLNSDPFAGLVERKNVGGGNTLVVRCCALQDGGEFLTTTRANNFIPLRLKNDCKHSISFTFVFVNVIRSEKTGRGGGHGE